MNHQETAIVYEWLAATYPRNYKTLSEEQARIKLDNLLYTFRKCAYPDVINTYHRAYTEQKTEPHPSEVLRMIEERTCEGRRGAAAPDPYEAMQRAPEWDQICRAYGEKIVRRTAKISMNLRELKYRLANGLDT